MLIQKMFLLFIFSCFTFPHSGVKLPGNLFGKTYEQNQWSGVLATGQNGNLLVYVDLHDANKDFDALYFGGVYIASSELTRIVYEKIEPQVPDKPRQWKWYRYDRPSQNDPWPANPTSVGTLGEGL